MPGHKEWFLFADGDFRSARSLLKSDDVSIPTILYVCQQSAEKALKTFIVYKNCPIKKTHDLVELVKLCSELDAEFTCLLDAALELSPIVTKVRYPDSAFVIPSISIAEHALKQVQTILEFVRNKVD